MPKRKPLSSSTEYGKVRTFIRQCSPTQWKKIKEFLRTGKRPKGLRKSTFARFAELGLDYKEAVNWRRRKPYMDLFSSADQKEVRKQIYDAVRLLMPGKKKQEQLVDDILRRTHPVRRADAQAEINFGLPESIFRQGGTYLDAIDPSNKAKARARGITGFSGFTSEEGINIGNRWKSKNYYKTTPFHEAVHFLVKANEYQAYTANFYYALKRGIMSESYLQRAKLANEPAKQARKKAIELFKIGSSENWRKANGLLRKEVVQK